MAAVIGASAGGTTTNAASYAMTAFTPAANDLIVVMVGAGATAATPGCTDDNADGLGTYTLIDTALWHSSADQGVVFVRDALIGSATSTTVTFTCTGDSADGITYSVFRVSGMSRTGSAASRQTAKQSNQAGGGTPSVTFGVAMDTNNPSVGCVWNLTNPAGLTPPTNWTEVNDGGYNTPAHGRESVRRDSGSTATTVTWNSTSASEFATLMIELDASAAASGTRVSIISDFGFS